MDIKTSPDTPQLRTQSGLAKDLAGQIIFISARELDLKVSYKKITDLLSTKLFQAEKTQYFQSVLQSLLSSEETETHAATCLIALYCQSPKQKKAEEFWSTVINPFIKGHQIGDIPSFRHHDSNKVFSAYAYTLGETFIQMMKLGASNYDAVSDLYTHCIRYENQLEKDRQLAIKSPGAINKDQFPDLANPKKLYDDVTDFISERAIHRSRTLNTNNPNDFIQILSDRLRSTRRYVIQEIINKDALKRKGDLEKALREKQASAEELIYASNPFKSGLQLFREAKLYNGRYVEAEKKRVLFQLIPILLGTCSIGLGLMDVITLSTPTMVIIGLFMVGGKFIFKPSLFARFYPKDITTSLEEEVALLAGVLAKCSKTQLTQFINKQIKEINDRQQISLITDFLTYIYSLIPAKKNCLVMNQKELRETLESMHRLNL